MNNIEEKYVIKTDKGYLKGDMCKGVEFVEKDQARIFNIHSLNAYWDSICSDLIQFYGVDELQSESL